MHPVVDQLAHAVRAALVLRHYINMSYAVICAGGLLALCLCGYGSAIATVLGAAAVSPGAVPTIAHAGEDRNEEQNGRSTWATWLGFYNPFFSTTACLGSAALLFKCASMIETGARATWTFGGDRFPRDLVEMSTLLRAFAVAAAGWQGLRIIKTYASDPRSIADTVTQSDGAGIAETAAVAASAAKAVLGGNTQAGTERAEEGGALLRNSRWIGLGLAALGGGMAITLLMRSGEEKTFDDVVKNARLSVAASLMGGAALGSAVRFVRYYV